MKTSNRAEIRQRIRKQRFELTPEQQRSSAFALLQHFSTDQRVKQAQYLALYLSSDGELNTQPLIDWCWQQGKSVYLPVIHPFTKGHLLFLKYTPHTQLTQNQYGISEPKLDIRSIILPAKLDIICTPLVAFDNTGARLGMGGGFYDRTLSSWYKDYQTNKNAKPYPLGIAHNCQQVDSLPCESWDIPLPEIFTPNKQHVFS
ncbi:5-formyltetrahydrofolate cyclo-ligase [Cognaticolwellia mytili]|uniref:5-formyltetrahydrofolate cyclo-ligase n=1 Tax=Cognaticolwellia mytili TaxID=1888913 RepID=UPI000A175281|nr:5-formyltetrahydrofolate cyclo-ligase [Cognaticolwellia mytili]